MVDVTVATVATTIEDGKTSQMLRRKLMTPWTLGNRSLESLTRKKKMITKTKKSGATGGTRMTIKTGGAKTTTTGIGITGTMTGIGITRIGRIRIRTGVMTTIGACSRRLNHSFTWSES